MRTTLVYRRLRLSASAAVALLSAFALLLISSTAFAQVCARVKIEIVQELTLERQAFDAKMRITNGLDNLSIQNISVSVNFQDAAGSTVLATSDPNNLAASFFITLSSTDGVTGGVTGNGTIAPSSVGEMHWLIIPAPGAAGPTPEGTLYFVGASVSYTLGGEPRTVDVVPDSIYVKPMPRLYLDYFLVDQVHSDNPYTPQVEPAEPFTLGVRVKNDGYGIARNLKIESSQPKIVENELGLLIAFQIIGSQVGNQDAAPVLLTEFGDIPSSESKVARWFMTSTLQGRFVEFTATFSHADELGGALTSLLEEVNTHVLIRDVMVTAEGRDQVKDFLAQDNNIIRVYESEGVDTVVNNASAVSTITAQGGGRWLLNTGPVAGFLWARVTDPHNGTKSITQVTRTDGRVLDPANAWLSREWVKASQSYLFYINVFDYNNVGPWDYEFEFGGPPSVGGAPVFGPTPDRNIRVGETLDYVVSATDPDGTIPTLSATQIPLGATFTQHGNGTATFSWAPTEEQLGAYPVDFGATDGLLFATARAIFTVVPADTTNAPPTSATASLWAQKNIPSAPVAPTVVDPDVGDKHFFEILTQPQHGTAAVVNNQLVYTPGTDYIGTDSFQFQAMDLYGETVVGLASVIVVDGDDLIAWGLELVSTAGSITSVEVELETIGSVANIVPVAVRLEAHQCGIITPLGQQTTVLQTGPTILSFPVDLSGFGDTPVVLVAILDPSGAFPETDEFNNKVARGVRLGAAPELSLALDSSAAAPPTYCAGEVLTATGRSFFTLHEDASSCTGPFAGAARVDYELENTSNGSIVRSGTVFANGNGAWHAEFGLPSVAGTFILRTSITDGESDSLLVRQLTTTTCAPAIPPPMVPPAIPPPMVPPAPHAGPSGEIPVVRFSDGVAKLPWTVYPGHAIPSAGPDGSGTYGHTRGAGNTAQAALNGPSVGTTGTGAEGFDASVNPADLSFTPATFAVGEPVTIHGIVQATDSHYGLPVEWEVTEPGGRVIVIGPPTWFYANGPLHVVTTYTPRQAGEHDFKLKIDPDGDSDPDNNSGNRSGDAEPPVQANSPVLSTVSPAIGLLGQTLIVQFTGQKFTAEASFDCGEGIAITDVAIGDLTGEFTTTATATFVIDADAAQGARPCAVTTAHGIYELAGAFSVQETLCDNVACNSPPSSCMAEGACNPGTGACEYAPSPAGTPCVDAITCTLGDTCNGAGVCGTPSHAFCNDGIACTSNICDPSQGCLNVPNDECDLTCPVGGDINGSGTLNVADTQCLILISFAVMGGDPMPSCASGPASIADLNCDNNINISDVQISVMYILQTDFSNSLDRNANRCMDRCEVPNCGDSFCGPGEDCLLCPQDCGGCAGSCTQAHEGAGCSDVNIQECVCDTLAECCYAPIGWTADCATAAPSCQ